jgi:hypothetical protein
MSSPTFRPSRRAILSSLAALALIVVVAAPAAAATPTHTRITKGDVTAAFQARTTGGYLNAVRGHPTPAPVRGLQHGRINPFVDSSNCSTDWHYFGVTLLGEGGHEAAAAFLSTVAISFTVDGTPLAGTTRLPIKPFVGTGIRGQFGVSVGKLIAPGSMALGDHTLETVIAVPGFDVQDYLVTFTLARDACG